MKRLFSLVLVCFFAAAGSALYAHEMRGVWVSTVGNIDFPSSRGISITQMQQETDRWLDTAKSLGFNAVFFQARPMGDAMYSSKIYPWSGFLTGKQGQAPAENFDPLRYWIDGAHKRGMQLHAWCNPYRVKHGQIKKEDLDPQNPAILHPEWCFAKNGLLYLNPGIPEVRKLVISGLVEIVTNYEVDGVHFDDYFYPTGSTITEDAETFKMYGGDFKHIEDWRRNNIDLLVQEIRAAVKQANPNVQWGISPFAIWANKGDNPAQNQHPEGSETRGNSAYYVWYADTKKWVKEGWIDYIVPQIYWHIGFEVADFKKITDWWCDVCEGTNVKLYVGMAAYRVGRSSQAEAWQTPDELIRQLDYMETKSRCNGFVMFTMNSLRSDMSVYKALMDYFTNKKPKIHKSVYIYLSPSSQNANIGFGDYLSEEYRMNQMAQHLKKHLLESGINVLPDLPAVTKEQLDDVNYNRMTLRARLADSMRRAKELEESEPEALFYHLALHTNAANRKARGAEIFVDPSNPKSAAFAEILLAASVALYHADNPEEAATHGNNENTLKWCRGVKDTGKLIEAQGTNTKNGVLIEFCFHDEEKDSKWMLRCIAEGEKEGGTNPLAKALANAIVEFVNRHE